MRSRDTDRRRGAWIIAAGLLTVALVACSSGQPAPTGGAAQPTAAAKAPAATTAPQPAVTVGAAQPTTAPATKPAVSPTTGAAAPAATSDKMTTEEVAAKLGAVPTPKKKYRIAAIEKTLINEHWQEMKKGYEAAAAKNGVEVVVQAARDETDLSGQLSIAETMLSQNFDAFSVSPASSSNLQPFLDKAKARNLPILNVDDAKVESRVFVGSDHREMGVLAAQLISKMLPDGADVAQIEGAAGSPAAQQRIDGYKSELAKHPNLKLVASVPGDWDRQKSLDAATNLLRANPNVKAIYANNDTMALGVIEAVRNAGKLGQIIIIGTDGVPDAIKAVRSGDMTGTVASFPYNMGYTAVEMAVRLLEGQAVPATVVSKQEMVTKDNVNQAFPQ